MGVTDGKLTVAGGYGAGGSLDTIEMMDEDGNWKEMPWKLWQEGQYPAMVSVSAAKVPTATTPTVASAPVTKAPEVTDVFKGHAGN